MADRGMNGRVLVLQMFKAIGTAVRSTGFAYEAVGCEGNYCGSMNGILPVEVLQDITQQTTQRPAR
jgi:hypothetical protein